MQEMKTKPFETTMPPCSSLPHPDRIFPPSQLTFHVAGDLPQYLCSDQYVDLGNLGGSCAPLKFFSDFFVLCEGDSPNLV